MLEVLVGRDVEEHHDEEHLAVGELAGAPPRRERRGPSGCVLQVDTESGLA